MIGIAVEGIVLSGQLHMSPVVVAIDGAAVLSSLGGLSCDQILSALHAGSVTGGDLVTLRVEWLVSLLSIGADIGTLIRLQSGVTVPMGSFALQLIPGVCLWVRKDGRSVRVTDLQRWTGLEPDEIAATYGVGRLPAVSRHEWGQAAYADAVAYAEQASAIFGALARSVDAALGRMGLPRYWRDGTGRVSGAYLDRIASIDDASAYPAKVARLVQSAFFGGRVNVTGIGCADSVTQIDIRSAYPAAMAELPSMNGARWYHRAQWDEREPFGIWLVRWNIPKGAFLGPFPVRLPGGDIRYPLRGEGWYWSAEIRAAREIFGPSMVNIRYGAALRATDENRPFSEGMRDLFRRRQAAKSSGDMAGSRVSKLVLVGCYGRIAQASSADGSPGRWCNLALAGLVTSITRAKMLLAAAEYDGRVMAIATDSLTIVGAADAVETADMGGWSVDAGSDAIVLPSGAMIIGGGYAARDRMPGVPRLQSRAVDWSAVAAVWRRQQITARYTISLPVYMGLGHCAASGLAEFHGRWRMMEQNIVGRPSGRLEPMRGTSDIWRVLPDSPSVPWRSGMFVPRTKGLYRLIDQTYQTAATVAMENDQPIG